MVFKRISKISLFKILMIICVVLGLILIVFLREKQRVDYQITDKTEYQKEYTIIFDNKEYKGVYDGDIYKGKPKGDGTFYSNDTELKYVGAWNNGLFHGTGKITYKDGNYEQGYFKKGKRNGLFIYTTNSGKKTRCYYSKDLKYGAECVVDSNVSKVINHYYNGKMIEEIKKKAIKFDVLELNQNSNFYKDKIITFDATVECVVQTVDTCYMRLKTDEGVEFICEYDNTFSSSTQAIIPNLEKNDKISMYAYYDGIDKSLAIDDFLAYEGEYPCIKPIYAEIMNKDGAMANSYDMKYTDIRKSPYLFTGLDFEKQLITIVKIKSMKKDGKNMYYIMGYSKNKKNMYMFLYQSDKEKVFLVGDRFYVKGNYFGQYKYIYNVDEETQSELVKENDNFLRGYEMELCPVVKIQEIDTIDK